jgi:hypothetical protein
MNDLAAAVDAVLASGKYADEILWVHRLLLWQQGSWRSDLSCNAIATRSSTMMLGGTRYCADRVRLDADRISIA